MFKFLALKEEIPREEQEAMEVALLNMLKINQAATIQPYLNSMAIEEYLRKRCRM
jgi:hypothetical protein